jgi:hypothetical protein
MNLTKIIPILFVERKNTFIDSKSITLICNNKKIKLFPMLVVFTVEDKNH